MKKSFQKKLLGFVFAAFFVAGTSAVFVSQSDTQQMDVAQAFENVDGIAQTALGNYASKYAVGETLVINNHKAVIDEKPQNVYVVLQKDYKVLASLSPDDEWVGYKLAETGEYNLLYFYVSEAGERVVLRNIAFTVNAEQAYFDVAFQSRYDLNSKIDVSAKCILGKDAVDAQVQVTSPFGEEIEVSRGSITLEQHGVYTIKYTAQIGEETVTKTYRVQVSSAVGAYKDYFSSISGMMGTEDNVQAPDYAIDGVGVKVLTEGTAQIRFNNVIDVSKLTKEDELVKFLPLSGDEYGKITQFSVKLIDIYDVNNVLEWQFKNSNSGSSTFQGFTTYLNAVYKGDRLSIDTRFANSMFVNSSLGVNTRVYCDADRMKTQYCDGMYYGYGPWARCQIDYEEKAMYVYSGLIYRTQRKVIDLDESWQVGYGNEWQGFTTGEAYLQLEIQSESDQSGFIISEVAGQKLYGEFEDTGKPSVYFKEEVDGLLPTGVVNENYKFHNVWYTNDLIDGTAYYPDYTITKIEYEVAKGLRYTDVELVSQESFIPKKAGVYHVTYEVIDKSGNVGERQTRMEIVNSLGEAGVDYTLSDELYVGDTITVPKLTPKGLSYLIKREESITYNGVEYVESAGEDLFLDKAGTLVVKCVYEDWLGNTYETEKVYQVIAKDEAVPKLLGKVPTYAMKGRTIVLPNYSAINYAKNEKIAWSLTVDGVSVDTTSREITVNGAHGDTVDVVYTVNGMEDKYQIKVIDAKYLSDRFYVTSGNATLSSEENYVSAKVLKDTTMDYIFPFILDASDFDFAFNFASPAGTCEYVDVYFEDYLNPEQRVFLRLKQKASGVTVQINGEGVAFSPIVATKHSGYTMKYNHYEHKFEFADDVLVKETMYGEVFKGFESNRVKVSFAFNGVNEETSFQLYELGSLTFLSEFSTGELKEYVDNTYPLLVSERSYLENEFTYGETVVIPAMEARTALSGLCTATLTITSPSGKKIMRDENAYNDVEVELTEYGTYKMVYSVPFRAGRKTYQYTFRVHQNEVAKVELTEQLNDSYRIGESITIPEAVVTGATGEYTVTYALSTPNGLQTHLQAGASVELKEYGTYVLSVYVQDKHNIVANIWTFKVEG